MLQRLVGQMMPFVEDVKAVLRSGQHHAAAEVQIGQHQIVVGDDNVGFLQTLARSIHAAIADIRAAPPGALTAVEGERQPVPLVDGLRPLVAVAVPIAAAERVEHGRIGVQGGALQGHGHCIGVQVEIAPAGAGQMSIELAQAEIAAAPFGQREVEGEPGPAADIGKVLVHELFLEGDGRRGQHQALGARPGHHQRGDDIREGLARAGARLDKGDGRRCRAVRLTVRRIVRLIVRNWPIVRADPREGPRHLGDHLPLPPARRQAPGLEHGVVGAADRLFIRVIERAHGASLTSCALRSALA